MSLSGDARFDTAEWSEGDVQTGAETSSLKAAEPPSKQFIEDNSSDDGENAGEGQSGGADDEGNDIPTKTVKPLSVEALAEFEKAQRRAGVIYISRIPPGMKPTKVRHLLSQYGEIGRVYLKQEDPKRAYLRRKHTSTKKVHYTEGWVEFVSKRIARSVADMLNGEPVGGKKGSRFRDDIWTMKYLPKFKWNMLTEQIAHEAATHAAKLRVELSQSRSEQRDYLKNVELARVLEKRAKRKRDAGNEAAGPLDTSKAEHKSDLNVNSTGTSNQSQWKRHRKKNNNDGSAASAEKDLDVVLGSLF